MNQLKIIMKDNIANHIEARRFLLNGLKQRGSWEKNRGRIFVIWHAGGANVYYLSNRYEKSYFTGIDISIELIEWGNERLREIKNCQLYQGDWFALDKDWNGKFDGIISFQTLSWLPEYQKPLKELVKLNPKWIAVSSLFYEGDIEYMIKLKDYYRKGIDKEYEEMYYNIYSLIQIKKYFKLLGYAKFEYKHFLIDIDIPRKSDLDIGTYTVRTMDNKRIQISGALMMPWYFIVASK